MLPVVAETWDGYLNEINGQHVESDDAGVALDRASPGPVPEGNVGGGTGMNCYGFKGGSGTASRVITIDGAEYTLGVFTQANFGSRKELRVSGVPLGRQSAAPSPIEADDDWLAADGGGRAVGGAGSVIVIIATDAPLLPGQCAALARRVPLGLGPEWHDGKPFLGRYLSRIFDGQPRGAQLAHGGARRDLPSRELELPALGLDRPTL